MTDKPAALPECNCESDQFQGRHHPDCATKSAALPEALDKMLRDHFGPDEAIPEIVSWLGERMAEAAQARDGELRKALETLTVLFEIEVPYVGGQRQAAFDKATKAARALIESDRG